MKRTHLTIIGVISMLLIAIVLLAGIWLRGQSGARMLEEITEGAILEATLTRRPPDDSATITDPELLEELSGILRKLSISKQDESAREYSGQLAEVSVVFQDGSSHTFGAYNPFLYVDGVPYRTEYAPCEALNSFVNRVLDNMSDTTSDSDAMIDGPVNTSPGSDTVTNEPAPSTDQTAEEYFNALPEDSVTFTARIVEVYDSSVLVSSLEPDAHAADLFTVNLKDAALFLENGNAFQSLTALGSRHVVEIAYNGVIAESYPAQIGAYALRIIREETSLIDFYFDVLQEWYNMDAGLNGDITMMGFDFSEMHVLTEPEKNALIYRMGSAHGLETVTGTWQELCDAGYIDGENLYWEDGILFTISDDGPIENEPLKKDTFTFSIEKWRSGLGAIGSSECKATLTKDGWEYESGAVWISWLHSSPL